jgi:ABC-type Zn2+ transport system substrate-binding protein/surface adhesin
VVPISAANCWTRSEEHDHDHDEEHDHDHDEEHGHDHDEEHDQSVTTALIYIYRGEVRTFQALKSVLLTSFR